MLCTKSLLIFLFVHIKINAVPPDACFANFRWDDCGKEPTRVLYYWKPGSRCEVGTWRGCLPNLNMFHDEYECVSTCIFTARAEPIDYHIPEVVENSSEGNVTNSSEQNNQTEVTDGPKENNQTEVTKSPEGNNQTEVTSSSVDDNKNKTKLTGFNANDTAGNAEITKEAAETNGTKAETGNATAPAGGNETAPAGGNEIASAGGNETVPAGGSETASAGGNKSGPADGHETAPAAGNETAPAGGNETATNSTA